MSIPYSRQLNRPVRYFGFFTIIELFVVVLSIIIIPQIFGFFTWMQFFAVLFLFIILMRVGKPEGHVWHVIHFNFRPRRYVGGRTKAKPMVIRSETEV